jgi:putative colanic acid biosynthesis acetyltransferase WcaF
MLLCGNHNYSKATFNLIVGDITLEEGVWVGAKAVVCPGVKMKSHSVLTAGSILTKDAEEYTIYQGNPAVPVKKRIIE